MRAQASLFETRETYYSVPATYGYLQSSRPSVQGRVAVTHSLDDSRRIEFGSGFAGSTTHVAETTVPSRVFTLDWFANPWRKLEFSGAFFKGQNIANLGGAGPGFTLMNHYNATPVHADGGWAQLSFLATPRLTFNLFGGEQQNRGRDLAWSDLAKNRAYGANLMYRIAPNVIVSLETEHLRTNYLGTSSPLNNHYVVRDPIRNVLLRHRHIVTDVLPRFLEEQWNRLRRRRRASSSPLLSVQGHTRGAE